MYICMPISTHKLRYMLRKLVCEIVLALYEQKNLRCVLVRTVEVDDILVTCGQYKHS